MPVPVDLSELCDAIKNDVVKKDPYNAKVENIEDLSLKCKISAIWLVETTCIFLILLFANEQISMECETQES